MLSSRMFVTHDLTSKNCEKSKINDEKKVRQGRQIEEQTGIGFQPSLTEVKFPHCQDKSTPLVIRRVTSYVDRHFGIIRVLTK